MFRIKICGITNLDDALAATAAGADAIGLNFFHGSKRCVDPSAARTITASLPAGVMKLGVFVNADTAQIAAVVQHVELDAIQLHGDERPAHLLQLEAGTAIVLAFRFGPRGLAPLRDYLGECRVRGRVPDAVLIDADAGANFGGTGRVADWDMLARERSLVDDIPFILAGGLTPANVAEAIRIVRPHGVDVASGVERVPGRKDAALVQQFVHAAREAFAAL
jgi:phosphoribosylanthranilate isomerase